EDDGAPLDVLDRHLPGGPLGERLDVAPAPVKALVAGPRLDGRDPLVPVPQRVEVGGFQRGDQGGVRTLDGADDVGHGTVLPAGSLGPTGTSIRGVPRRGQDGRPARPRASTSSSECYGCSPASRLRGLRFIAISIASTPMPS